jgi:hypothetical protein
VNQGGGPNDGVPQKGVSGLLPGQQPAAAYLATVLEH